MKPQRILFATMPMDGHFSPLTSLAVHLKQLGHDVRWYVGGHYGEKVTQLGLPHYPFRKALVVNQDNLDTLFPERKTIRNAVRRLRFDVNQVFLLRIPEFVDDLTSIHQAWPFELLIHDVTFAGGVFAQQLLGVKTVAVGVVPLGESDENVGPSGLGMPPRYGFWGRQFLRLTRLLVQDVLLKSCHDLYARYRQQYGLSPAADFVFDDMIRKPDLYLQSGVPGFEYARQHISPNVRFVGPLLPYSRHRVRQPFEQAALTFAYRRVVLVTQGTIERDVEKIIVPTLEAFKNDPSTLVIATTGGSQTEDLRDRFPQPHLIIEDFIDFQAVMPYVNAYVTNGGYGGVMQALMHRLPIVAAGIHEGKNEIAARIAYCGVGINLKTETPGPAQIRQAVNRILSRETYQQNVRRLSRELSACKPIELAEHYIDELLMREPIPTTELA